jgi:hypothetical protein
VYLEALRRQGLTQIDLPVQTWEVTTGDGPSRSRVVERDTNGRHVRMVVMPPAHLTCDQKAADVYRFARAGNRVYAIESSAQWRKVEPTICPCPGCACPTPTNHCDGALRPATGFGFELPADVEFGGERQVKYFLDDVRAGTALPPQPVCLPGPKPAARS